MKLKHKNSKIHNRKIFIFVGVLLLITCILAIVMLYNSRNRNAITPASSNQPSINNNPNTNTDTKTDAVNVSPKTNDEPTQTTVLDIAMTISNASQDSSGGPIVIRTIVNSLESGTCTYSLTKDAITKSYKNSLDNMGMYYGCNIDIQPKDLTNGDYSLTIEVANGSHKGLKTTNISVSGL